ncbi:MAG: hypothetical protein DMG35_08410 [Acidobacteria bacterium]|nr:MAG: hypothetical protein AUH86_21610 [Acidobacteria bacterium 13_1_40CM_4_58_4]PYT61989.1 MAG: hypothetical protein DMG35_08410 [Acidobacteriota bacterium]
MRDLLFLLPRFATPPTVIPSEARNLSSLLPRPVALALPLLLPAPSYLATSTRNKIFWLDIRKKEQMLVP